MESGREFRLPVLQRLFYGFGHVLNDLCASMWFSYLLVYLHYVLKFNNQMAVREDAQTAGQYFSLLVVGQSQKDTGYLLLLGQVADALVTPFIGIEADRSKGICTYGKRKSWHIVGSACVMVSFPFLFNTCIGCSPCDPDKPSVFKESCWVQFAYYAPFVVIFQFGWAATQVSHLSLIPELSSSDNIRVELNAIRYAFTVISNIVVYLLAWILLQSYLPTGNSSKGSKESRVGSEDTSVFRILSLSVVGIGAVFVLLFHIGTPEKREKRQGNLNCNDLHTPSGSQSGSHGMTWNDWFKEIQFYQVAVIYMCTRLIVNLSQIYMPMYLTDALQLEQTFRVLNICNTPMAVTPIIYAGLLLVVPFQINHYIAMVPLIIYISGFAASLLMGPINKLIGRKGTYVIGCVFTCGACIWFWFISKNMMTKQIIGGAIVLGIGTSVLLVTSLSMTADLIGNHKGSSAFVYGAMSFTDKLSNGLAVVVIQHLNPCNDPGAGQPCSSFYRDVMVFVVGGLSIAVFFLLITLSRSTIGNLKKFPLVQDCETECLIANTSSTTSTTSMYSNPTSEIVCPGTD